MFFKYFSRQIYFSRTFQDSPVYSSTFQACANPGTIQPLITITGGTFWASNYYNHRLVHIKLHVLAVKLQALLVSKNIGMPQKYRYLALHKVHTGKFV